MNDVSNKFPTIVTGFGYAPIGPALWIPDEVTGMLTRDLSLRQASDDVLIGRHLRAAGQRLSTNRLVSADSQFVFLFVLAGQVTMTEEGSAPVILSSLDSLTRHGAGKPVDFAFTHDAEVIMMQAAQGEGALFGTGDGGWKLSIECEDDYLQGEGLRSYFRYRNLGVADATERRIDIHVVRSTKAVDGGTGWHSHDMGQVFYVLRGWADLAVERQQWVKMTAGDMMCVSKGMRHNVPAFSSDYLLLEMCIPADYDTMDAPAG